MRHAHSHTLTLRRHTHTWPTHSHTFRQQRICACENLIFACKKKKLDQNFSFLIFSHSLSFSLYFYISSFLLLGCVCVFNIHETCVSTRISVLAEGGPGWPLAWPAICAISSHILRSINVKLWLPFPFL